MNFKLTKFASSHEKFEVWPGTNVSHNLRRRSRKGEVLKRRMGGGFLSLPGRRCCLFLSFPLADTNNAIRTLEEDLFAVATCCCQNHLLIKVAEHSFAGGQR